MTITLNSNVELHKMTVHIELEILMPRTVVIDFFGNQWSQSFLADLRTTVLFAIQDPSN